MVENLENELSILMEDDELSTLMTEEHESPKMYPKKFICFIDKLADIFDDNDKIKQECKDTETLPQKNACHISILWAGVKELVKKHQVDPLIPSDTHTPSNYAPDNFSYKEFFEKVEELMDIVIRTDCLLKECDEI